MKEYDYVIVGGGTAGCVLANRLTNDSDVNVLLLEAGRRDKHPFIHMPVGFAKMTSGPFTWGLTTVPQKYACNREIPYAQARVIGGGSSINAEVFTRGNPADYDRWANEQGCKGWSFNEIQKYFIRSEGNTVFSGEWHGAEGPLGVSNIPDPEDVTLAFVRACQEFGIPYNPDFNGPEQAGASVYQTTTLNGRRCSAAVGYLRPAEACSNLDVRTDFQVSRILFEGDRAVGIEGKSHGQQVSIKANREILLTCGAIGTPKLMLLSGVGPANHLQDIDIKLVHNLPGVGENLNDHFGVDIVAELNGSDGLDKYDKWYWSIWAAMEYYLFRSGPITSNVVEGGAFWFADTQSEVPDLQFHFLAGSGKEKGVPGVPNGYGITLNSYTLRPRSRGTVRLRSNSPFDLSLIDPAFMEDPYDQKTSAEGIRVSIEIFNQPSLRKYIKKILYPAQSVKTEQEFIEYARQFGRTSYHPTGTCKMGTDSMSVVDPNLNVHGIECLRICDSSIMPSLIGSNTNAPTVMIAEKASEMILAGS